MLSLRRLLGNASSPSWGSLKSSSNGSASTSCQSPIPRRFAVEPENRAPFCPSADLSSTHSFVLYLVFYPRGAKYVRSLPLEAHAIPPERPWSDNLIPAFMRSSTPANYVRRASTSSSQSDASSISDFDPRSMLLPGQVRHSTIILSEEYRRALSLFFLTLLHLLLSGVTTAILLVTLPRAPHSGSPPAFPGGGGKEHPSERAVRVWATTLGLASVVLACVQYLPQLLLTARRKLVGSLSIPMMLLQVRFASAFRASAMAMLTRFCHNRLPDPSSSSTLSPSDQVSTGAGGRPTCTLPLSSSHLGPRLLTPPPQQHHWHPSGHPPRPLYRVEKATEATGHRRLGKEQGARRGGEHGG